MRLSKGAGSGKTLMSEDDMMLTKAYLDPVDAQEEAARLNDLNGEFWHYFSCVARLVDGGSAACQNAS